jgi:predicted negative regulator of RcsB-dependent stress response
MDANTISQLITTLGFPIVLVGVLVWFIWRIYNDQKNSNEAREEKLYEVVANAQAQNVELSETNAKFVGILETYKSDLEEIKHDVTDIKSHLSKE